MDESGVSQRLGYRPALDGLRAVAILLVLGDHFLHLPPGGGYGVDLFFVLSGFLITTLLLEERRATGRIDISRFYIRRARRLLPALGALLLTFLAIEAVREQDGLPRVAEYGLYFGNIFQAYVADHHTAAHFGLAHLWSLAEEEQFYLVWPAVLVVLVRARRPARWLACTFVALTAYRTALVILGFGQWHLQKSPDTHSTGLVLGSLAAFARPRVDEGVAWLSTAVAAVVAFLVFPGYGTVFFELAAAGMVLSAAAGDTSFARDLSHPWLVWIGRISYSLYLWHFMLLWAFGFQERLAVLVLSVAAAWLSYRFVEQPFRRRRGRIRAAAQTA